MQPAVSFRHARNEGLNRRLIKQVDLFEVHALSGLRRSLRVRGEDFGIAGCHDEGGAGLGQGGNESPAEEARTAELEDNFTRKRKRV